MARHQSPARRGVTLIELLIVIGIMTVIATLVGVYVVPAFSDNKNVIRCLDRVSITLLQAKQRALRDQAGRGVRFIPDSTGSYFTQMQLIELPEPLRTGTVTATTGSTTATFTGVDFIGAGDANDLSAYTVQPGDYLRYMGTTSNYPISGYPALGAGGTTTLTLKSPVQTAMTNTSNYQIVRQTRPITGESPVTLPDNVVIDIATYTTPAANRIPTGVFPTPSGAYEILFDPSGAVMNRGGSTPIGMIIYDVTADSPLDANTTRVLAIYPRTGMIAGHPVGPSGSPLQYALDGKSSGM